MWDLFHKPFYESAVFREMCSDETIFTECKKALESIYKDMRSGEEVEFDSNIYREVMPIIEYCRRILYTPVPQT